MLTSPSLDRAVTNGVGGLIAPQVRDLVNKPLTAVLDVNCGTEAWLTGVREQHSSIKHLAGIDKSDKLFPADQSGLVFCNVYDHSAIKILTVTTENPLKNLDAGKSREMDSSANLGYLALGLAVRAFVSSSLQV
jgi:hypothetical protein